MFAVVRTPTGGGLGWTHKTAAPRQQCTPGEMFTGASGESFALATYKVKQEVPADGIILDQMGCDVGGRVGGKGHQEVCSRYCQGATCDKESRGSG